MIRMEFASGSILLLLELGGSHVHRADFVRQRDLACKPGARLRFFGSAFEHFSLEVAYWFEPGEVVLVHEDVAGGARQHSTTFTHNSRNAIAYGQLHDGVAGVAVDLSDLAVVGVERYLGHHCHLFLEWCGGENPADGPRTHRRGYVTPRLGRGYCFGSLFDDLVEHGDDEFAKADRIIGWGEVAHAFGDVVDNPGDVPGDRGSTVFLGVAGRVVFARDAVHGFGVGVDFVSVFVQVVPEHEVIVVAGVDASEVGPVDPIQFVGVMFRGLRSRRSVVHGGEEVRGNGRRPEGIVGEPGYRTVPPTVEADECAEAFRSLCGQVQGQLATYRAAHEVGLVQFKGVGDRNDPRDNFIAGNGVLLLPPADILRRQRFAVVRQVIGGHGDPLLHRRVGQQVPVLAAVRAGGSLQEDRDRAVAGLLIVDTGFNAIGSDGRAAANGVVRSLERVDLGLAFHVTGNRSADPRE